jgi:WD40 repeat protein
MVYFTACICVIYDWKLNEQEHYLLHEKEIISICNSMNNELIATGELALSPSIHIWNVKTLQNLGVLKGHHKNGVHLLNFFHSDQYLASCGIKFNSPVLIYNL